MSKSKKDAQGNHYQVGSTKEDSEIEMSNTNDNSDLDPESGKPYLSSTPATKDKRHYGASLCFAWRNNEPMFTIGPHCKNHE